MALINCPECNKEISDQAKTCVNCGYMLKKQTGFIDELVMGLLVFVIIICIALGVTNPTKEQYVSWAKNQVSDTTSNNIGKAVVNTIGGVMIDSMTVRHNYYLYSIYETNMGDKEKHTVLGVLGNFVPLEVFMRRD